MTEVEQDSDLSTLVQFVHAPDAYLSVWACEHLWYGHERGIRGDEERIADAAEALLLDCGENVAACEVCDSFPAAVPMTRREIQVGYRAPDREHLVILGIKPFEGQ